MGIIYNKTDYININMNSVDVGVQSSPHSHKFKFPNQKQISYITFQQHD